MVTSSERELKNISENTINFIDIIKYGVDNEIFQFNPDENIEKIIIIKF
jgi:hypothetical protein